MAAALRDVVRLAVTRTNHLWPLSSLHRGIYRLAIARFLSHCARFGEVKSVYLRHGMTRPDWVPGLSDIDWTVVIEDMADEAREHAFLIAFWRGFATLKRSFPMLGEIDVLPRRWLRAWSLTSIRGCEAAGWKRCAGSEARVPAYVSSPLRLAIDSIDHALLIYANQLSRRTFAEPHQPEALRRLEVERLSLKIRRYVRAAANETADSPAASTPSMEESTARALLALDRAVGAFAFSAVGDTRSTRLAIARPSEREALVSGVDTVVRAFSVRLAILREGLDSATIAETLRGIGESAREGPPRVVVTPALFRHWLRIYDPFLHGQLELSGRVTAGGAIALPSPPHDAALARQIFEQGPNVLAFPQSRECITGEPAVEPPSRVVESLVERALSIRLLVEKGILRRTHGALAAECAKQYGDVLAQFEDRRRRTNLHGAIRRLADEVGAALERSAGMLGELAADAARSDG